VARLPPRLVILILITAIKSNKASVKLLDATTSTAGFLPRVA
jgi:hypothetical protein